MIQPAHSPSPRTMPITAQVIFVFASCVLPISLQLTMLKLVDETNHAFFGTGEWGMMCPIQCSSYRLSLNSPYRDIVKWVMEVG